MRQAVGQRQVQRRRRGQQCAAVEAALFELSDAFAKAVESVGNMLQFVEDDCGIVRQVIEQRGAFGIQIGQVVFDSGEVGALAQQFQLVLHFRRQPLGGREQFFGTVLAG
ncbi:MAG: hypothetical protein BWY76_02269 [bacterium ADurb.Bin429]|nr:MAG: hypothetical protein BWY76_02269 [bacterium ADurb.Bin429]